MNVQFATGAPRLLSPARASAIAMAVAVTVGQVHAQNLQPVARNSDTGAVNTAASDTDTSEVQLLVGRSTLLNVGNNITRVSLTSPNVADAMVTTPSQLLIHGKAPGTISMFVWDKAGGIKRFEVVVRRDLSQLGEQLKQLFPGEPISIHSNGKDVVISGVVTSKYVVDKAAEVTAGYVEKKEDVVNLLRQQEGVATNQVLLRVRFAEVSRSAMTELGASVFTNGLEQGRWYGRTTTDQVPGPTFDDGKLIFSDFLNLFLFDAKNQIGGVIRALQNKGLFQSLAEPNLIAENGKEASFLAGGEYPYPVVQSGTASNSITIQFKEFGVRLNFTPTIVGDDLVKIKVRPEVSSLDFSNALTLQGFRVPAISTRRTETEVELQDGQTFAIAGLMNNTVTDAMRKIPGIGDIPILGWLFKSKAMQKNQTELVVMITPTIVRKGSMGVSEGLPNPVEPYMGRPDKVNPNPDAYTGSPRYPATESKPKQPAPAPAPNNQASRPAAQPSKSVPSKPVTSKSTPLPNGPATSPAATTSIPITPANTFTPNQPAMPAGTFTPNTPANAPASAPMMPAQMPSAQGPAAQPAGQRPASTQDPKEQQRLVSKAQEQEKRAAEAEARERATSDKRKAEQDAAAKRQADKLAKERAARDAEIARRNDEKTAKDTEQSQKREKALAEAAIRLKQAQEAYESELQKAKSGTDKPEKKDPKDPSSAPAPMSMPMPPMPPMPQTSKQ
jgi:pilus assembly protein CpaC